jgi:hypothetical protein
VPLDGAFAEAQPPPLTHVEIARRDECFARDLEDRGKARATVARRLCTDVGFYRYAEEEGVIEHSPAVTTDRHSQDGSELEPREPLTVTHPHTTAVDYEQCTPTYSLGNLARCVRPLH